MSIDPRYTWDSARTGGNRFRGSRRRQFGSWVLIAVCVAIVLHAIILWVLGRLNLWLQRSGQGQVEPELIQHIRVALAQQQRILPGRQPGLAAAGQLRLGRWCAEGVQIMHAGGAQFAHCESVHSGKSSADAVETELMDSKIGFSDSFQSCSS